MPVQSLDQSLTPEQLDAIAQSRGYRDYAHMIYVAKNGLPRPQQDNATNPNTANTGGGGFTNFLQQLFSDPKAAWNSAMAWHPAHTIGMAGDALKAANERNK